MSTTLDFKDIIDLPQWRPESPLIAATGAGMTMVSDGRNDETRNPNIYLLRSNTALDVFDPGTGDWMPLASPALGGTFGAGAGAVFHASAGPRGTIAAGSTSTVINLTTALPATVGINQLANRGDGVGYRIRIIGSSAGGSGKIEERNIIANTGQTTTPAITLDSALTFTPASGDSYEIISGRVFLLGAAAPTTNTWRFYDIATNSYSTSLSTTNLPATISTDSAFVSLSELHTPNDRSPSTGFVNGGATADGKNAIQATASTANTITGSGMTAIATNEYRNFQVRIVEDTTTPTAVGQRRRISSHTSGAAGVFTLSTNWTVNPSTSAKFVVENDDDKIILRSSGTTALYNYNITANTWDTSTWAAPVANGAGSVATQAYGITRDGSTGGAKHSFVVFIRGAATSNIDILDIAGAATGSWTNGVTYGNSSQTFTTGTCGAYVPATQGGRFLYINVNGTQRFARFDVRNLYMDPGTYLRFPQSTAIVGGKMAVSLFVDGATKLPFIYHATNTQAQMFSIAVQT